LPGSAGGGIALPIDENAIRFVEPAWRNAELSSALATDAVIACLVDVIISISVIPSGGIQTPWSRARGRAASLHETILLTSDTARVAARAIDVMIARIAQPILRRGIVCRCSIK